MAIQLGMIDVSLRDMSDKEFLLLLTETMRKNIQHDKKILEISSELADIIIHRLESIGDKLE